MSRFSNYVITSLVVPHTDPEVKEWLFQSYRAETFLLLLYNTEYMRVTDSRDKILSVPEYQQNLTFSYSLSLRIHGALLLQAGSTIQQSEKKIFLLIMRFIDNGTFLCSLLIMYVSLSLSPHQRQDEVRWEFIWAMDYTKRSFQADLSQGLFSSVVCVTSPAQNTVSVQTQLPYRSTCQHLK